MDEGGFIVDYVMPAGSSLRETNRVISHVEQILRNNAGGGEHFAPHGFATRLGDRYGSEHGRHQREIETDGAVLCREFSAPRPGGQYRTKSGEEVIADVRAKIQEAEPVLDVEFPQLLQDMIGDLTSSPEPVVIKLFTPDPEVLRRWAPLVASTIKKIPGVVDVEDGIENHISGTALMFNVDPW